MYEAESLELEMTYVEHRMGKPDQQRLYRKKKKKLPQGNCPAACTASQIAAEKQVGAS